MDGFSVLAVQHQAEVFCDDNGQAEILSGTMLDVTELRQAQDQILQLARFDSLTGLSNRSVFRERVQSAMEKAARNGYLGAVLFLDLDNFKRINDTFGHGMGDLLLQEVAKRLNSSVRSTDAIGFDHENSLVARFGGDEFTVLLPQISRIRDAERVARRILESIGHSIDLAGHEVVVTPSIGIAIFPNHGEDVDNLMKNVDAAMYYVKHAGKNNYELFVKSMNVVAERRLALESSLRRAIDEQELSLHYQPQIDIASRRVVRGGGSVTLAQPGTGYGIAGRVYPSRGRNRPDQADRRVGYARSLLAGASVATAGTARDPDGDQPLSAAVR